MAPWFTTSFVAVAATILSTLAVFACVILYTRVCGVRSFAKMSGFDFAMTIAVGSVIAGTALYRSVPVPVGITALTVLFATQWVLAKVRQRWPAVSGVIDNRPILVLYEGEVLDDNLRRAAMSEDDLWSKLREANCLQIDHARAVIVEATGDVTVLHGDPSIKLESRLFRDVRGLDAGPDRLRESFEREMAQ